MHQRLQLLTALGADEGMKFVDHEELQCAKRCCNGCAFSDQQSFKRLWRDQQHPARTGEKLGLGRGADIAVPRPYRDFEVLAKTLRSEEHTSELQSLMRISYAVFCLKKKKTTSITTNIRLNSDTTSHFIY